jgi:hypothetical protein
VVLLLQSYRATLWFLLVLGGRWEVMKECMGGGRERGRFFLARQYTICTIKMKWSLFVQILRWKSSLAVGWNSPNFSQISGDSPINKTDICLEYAKALPASMAI